IYLITIRSEYLNLFDNISQKALRLWNILSRTVLYRKHVTAQDAVIISTLMFNEGLYDELKNYCEVCIERYPSEKKYFRMLDRLASVYSGERKDLIREIREVLQEAQALGDVYYGLNLFKLRKDLEALLRRVEAGKSISLLKIEFINQKRKGGSWLRRFLKRFKDVIDKIFRRDNNLHLFEGALCSKNFQTPYINS
ncbi:MAG: hypothetical protein ACK42C_08870, partial [Aquificaceae bacterium]